MLAGFDITPWLWVIVIVAALLVETATPSLVSIWFALGALAALTARALSLDLTGQILVFVFVSLMALLLARPLARRLLDPHIVPTNADRIIGIHCRVTEAIDNRHFKGAVYADGKIWTARSESGREIPAGEAVEILRMDGIKVIVRPVEE